MVKVSQFIDLLLQVHSANCSEMSTGCYVRDLVDLR